ncbi:MAG: energy transducer TonB [Marinifilaceae bacterium]
MKTRKATVTTSIIKSLLFGLFMMTLILQGYSMHHRIDEDRFKITNDSIQLKNNSENHKMDKEKSKLCDDIPRIFINPDDGPVFLGKPVIIQKYIAENIRYPKRAKKLKLSGKVFVSFTINSDGTISDAKVVRGVHKLLDAEAIRIISTMPKWRPGKVNGKPTTISYTLPVNFKLPE